ncbi:hypothetical protein MC885_016107, partial [Smutsia gigantea]
SAHFSGSEEVGLGFVRGGHWVLRFVVVPDRCRPYEDCCGSRCCVRALSIQRLWYFWFLLMMGVLFCCGAGFFLRRRMYPPPLIEEPAFNVSYTRQPPNPTSGQPEEGEPRLQRAAAVQLIRASAPWPWCGGARQLELLPCTLCTPLCTLSHFLSEEWEEGCFSVFSFKKNPNITQISEHGFSTTIQRLPYLKLSLKINAPFDITWICDADTACPRSAAADEVSAVFSLLGWCTLSAAGILGPFINHTNKQESDPTTSDFRLLPLVNACYKFPDSGVFQLFSAFHMATRRLFKEEGSPVVSLGPFFYLENASIGISLPPLPVLVTPPGAFTACIVISHDAVIAGSWGESSFMTCSEALLWVPPPLLSDT